VCSVTQRVMLDTLHQLNNAAGAPVTGNISASPINLTYNYDGNVQGAYPTGTDNPVILIGIRPGSGRFVVAAGLLTRSASISLSLVVERDRVYA